MESRRLLSSSWLAWSHVLREEFYVSDTVLDQCNSLQQVFEETCQELLQRFESIGPGSFEHIRNDAKRCLVYFDRSWCSARHPEALLAFHSLRCSLLLSLGVEGRGGG